MTRRTGDLTPPAKPTRAQRKAELLSRIEQQRIDILVEAERWQLAAAPLDAGWQRLKRYRGLVYLAGGALLVGSARHPNSLIRLVKRLAAGGLLLNRARRLLQQVR
ncbi:YqjK-like family protein [Halomonas sp. LR3S48]|uniref:YqjK-like family protein n=1 Tax=Halomonas sp. LR3S48 TaxID=2982694 RepID=UPI0021E4FF5B|nr:YqjK-like family protein [Halomonas sp. LR3S48]UYG05270.1 YqjK-like family protein [Halomonas sp. LR3S48]